MKKYAKPQMMAKNAPTGSYAAGCPSKGTGKTFIQLAIGGSNCKKCERSE